MDEMLCQETADYRAGFAALLRLHAEAQRRGWRVTERFLVREIRQLEHSAHAPTSGRPLPVLDRPLYAPDWYRGRADALRQIVREQREGTLE